MAESYIESLLGEQENILLIARQHWSLMARSILLEVVAIFIIIAAAVASAMVFPVFAWIIAAAAAILLLVPLATLIRDFLVWFNRMYIITNRRVMQISGVINKSVTDSSLEKVNDVKMVQSALGRIFDFGDIEILTASELGVNLFRWIDHPVQFKTAMLNAKARLEGFEETMSRGNDLPALIEQLDQLRQRGILSEAEFQEKKAQLLSKI
jgi:uncharacterized membrane protein YdbT with pleckstrin-like domain